MIIGERGDPRDRIANQQPLPPAGAATPERLLAALDELERIMAAQHAALRAVAALPHAPADGVGTDGAAHLYTPGHPMGCPICEALDTALAGVQADNKDVG